MDWTPATITREVAAAAAHVRQICDPVRDMIRNYHGQYFTGRTGRVTDTANHSADYVSIMLPQAIFQDPLVEVITARGGAPEEVSRALKAALTRWMADSMFHHTLEKLILDQFFAFSVGLVTQRANMSADMVSRMPKELRKRFGKGGVNNSMLSGGEQVDHAKPMWPTLKRIAPWNFIFDPLCEDISEARYMGHRFVRSRRQLLELAKQKGSGWNRTLLEGARMTTDMPAYLFDENVGSVDMNDRDDVVLVELHVPEQDTDGKDETDGCHGTIYTLLMSDANGEPYSEFVRAPRPYFGPRSGPYCVGGIYPVPNSPIRLAPLALTKTQSDDLNSLEHSITESAKDYKRVLGIPAHAHDTARKLLGALHNYMIPIQGMEQSEMSEFEIAGVTEQQMAQVEYMRARLERSSGITDAVRGNVSGIATATENAIASDAASVRLGYVLTRVDDYASQALKKIAWYMYHDDRIVFPVGIDDFAPIDDAVRAEIGNVSFWFEGGTHDPESGYTFDDLELKIEAGSMRKRNTLVRRQEFTELANMSLAFVQVAPMFPWVRWDAIVKRLGEMYDVRDWHKNFDFAQAGQSIPLLNPEPKTQGNVTGPKGNKPSININAGGGRGGAAKPATPKPTQGKK